MKQLKRSSWALVILALGCSPGADDDTSGASDNSVTAIADRYVEAYFAHFPQTATLSGASTTAHDMLPDNSMGARANWHNAEDEFRQRLSTIDPVNIRDPGERVTFGFLTHWLESSVAFRTCRMELWNVSPTWTGWQSEFALLASVQAVATEEERTRALKRFGQLPAYLDTEIENLREGIRLQYTAPRTNVNAVLEQVTQLVEAPLDESPFVNMAPEGAADFRNVLAELTRDQIRPAITRYRDFLRDEYLGGAREEVGVSANTGGTECYQAAIRFHATVDLTPQEVHDIGLSQMEKIHEEMRLIGERTFGSRDIPVMLETVRSDPRFLFTSRQQMIDRAQSALERAQAEAPNWFGLLPAAQVVIEPYPSFQEATAPGGFYNPPAEDGSRPGVYLINTYQPEQQPIAGLESTAFHETYPGHHLQGAIALERGDLHPISRYFYLSGFGEGWGLYAERLADEMGLFTSDVDRMGLFSAEAHRAGRLVVDTGLHALGWTRGQAIDYLLANTALSSALAAAEIDRYIAVPGQATSYMLGNLEIRRLRQRAVDALGDGFDIKVFHDRVLEDGAVPLVMLAEKIERWIAEEGGGEG